MTVLEQTERALAMVPASRTPTGWTFPRHLWTRLVLNPLAKGLVAFTSDPSRPTLHGLPVTVTADTRAEGFALHTEPMLP